MPRPQAVTARGNILAGFLVTLLYFSLFAIGVIFTIVTSLLSIDGGADVAGHGDIGGEVSIPIFSPTILSVFITGFGGIGAILRMTLGLHPLAEVGLAAAGGLGFAFVGLAILGAITRRTQVGSEYATHDLVGGQAEVITPIPENGLGEVAYVKKGTRSNAPARSRDGRPIPRNTDVRIVSVSGTTMVVEMLPSDS
ncbi:MAG TPA: NfeD family protein [Thermoanaerobaculia bacterium]|nr:NfeD family protein [Thermoanaerobaculia bacterium]